MGVGLDGKKNLQQLLYDGLVLHQIVVDTKCYFKVLVISTWKIITQAWSHSSSDNQQLSVLDGLKKKQISNIFSLCSLSCISLFQSLLFRHFQQLIPSYLRSHPVFATLTFKQEVAASTQTFLQLQYQPAIQHFSHPLVQHSPHPNSHIKSRWILNKSILSVSKWATSRRTWYKKEYAPSRIPRLQKKYVEVTVHCYRSTTSSTNVRSRH